MLQLLCFFGVTDADAATGHINTAPCSVATPGDETRELLAGSQPSRKRLNNLGFSITKPFPVTQTMTVARMAHPSARSKI
jgi:hypothetical protein